MSSPRFSSVGIYSVGLLGGSIGLALKASGFKGQITGFSSEKSLETALQIGCIDKGYTYDKLENLVHTIDILFLCSPINTILATLRQLRTFTLPDNLLITDIGSTKKEIMDTAASLPANVTFIGGHPMAGSEKSGPSAADPYLFQNAVYVLTPQADVNHEINLFFAQFLKEHLGCHTVTLDPSVHDTIAATISHIPHLLAVSLVNHARTMEERIPGTLTLAAGGFRDMTRIASTPFPMWKDIFETNRAVIDSQVDSLIAILQDVKRRLKSSALQELFDKANETRSRISSGNKGFASQLYDVLILAPDQPGVIAKISSILAQQQINIKDIEVLKVRENEGGTIRIGFDTHETSFKAVVLLNEHGFSARERK